MGELMRLRPELRSLLALKGKTVAVVNSAVEGTSDPGTNPCIRVNGVLETDPRHPDGTGKWGVIPHGPNGGCYVAFTQHCVSLILAQPKGSTFAKGVVAMIFVSWQHKKMPFGGRYGEF